MFNRIATIAAPVDINGALKDLKDELDAGTAADEAVKSVCEDYDGLKPDVLTMRFEKAYGSAPADYKHKPIGPDINKIVQETLQKELKRWRITPEGQKLVGKTFTNGGEKWVFVAFDGRKVTAVRADTGKVWEFTGTNNINMIMKQVGK